MAEIQSLLSFLLVLAMAYCLSGGGLAWLTEWRTLVRLYRHVPGPRRFSEGSFRGVGARVANTPCGLSLEIYPEGLWLSPGIFHSLVMPAVLIPWDKITPGITGPALFGKRTELQVAGHPGIVICGRPGAVVAEKATIFQQ